MYRAPSGDLNVFFTILEDILQTATMKHNRKILLLGDFHIPRWKEDNSNAMMKDVIGSFDLSITITEPTKVTKNTVSTIDNIFTNDKDFSSSVVAMALSNHYAQRLRIIMPISSAKVENTYTERRIITSGNLTEMEEYVNTIDWSSIIND
ncbi:hypothetical protein QE152_g32518 [Popillia japonica]|uniref:Uncharacterized protein n=1 Tax=Popillia japonica TaxID=7064 RepID=A0AAW1IYR0_POPJA